MNIEEAIKVVETAISKGGKKEELKLKQSLSIILHELKYKSLDAKRQAALEKELEDLVLHIDENEEQLKKSYKSFIRILQKDFCLVPEGHCAGNGLVYGLVLGLLLLSFTMVYIDSSLKYLLPLGSMLVGMFAGTVCDHQVKKQGRALLTKIY